MTAYNLTAKNKNLFTWTSQTRAEWQARKDARRKVIEEAHRKEREAYKRMMQKRGQATHTQEAHTP